MAKPERYFDYLLTDIPTVVANVEEGDSSDLISAFPNGVPRIQDKTKLGPLETKIITLHISGFKNVEIEKICGVDKQKVSNTLHHPDAAAIIEEAVQSVLKATISTVRNEYVAHAHEAFKTTLTLMRTSKNDRIKLEAARDITKVSGVLESKASDGETPITNEAARMISATMKELAEETVEFTPLGNSEDINRIRNEALDAEVVDELINQSA